MTATFAEARREHNVVKVLSEVSATLAENLWDGLAGREVAPNTIGEAAQDTLPEDCSTLLALNDVAAAYAFSCIVDTLDIAYGNPPSGQPHEIRDRCRTAWERFMERANSAQELSRGFGSQWGTADAWTAMLNVAPRNDQLDEIKRIARLSGRMFASLRGGYPTRVAAMSGEIASIELGNTVARLLPSELGQIALGGELETAALYRVSTRRALQYSVNDSHKASRGPLVLLLDESTSMLGQRNEWSKAVALAVARVAAEDNRRVAIVHYSTSVKHQTLVPNNPTSVMEMIRTFLSGGTRISLALNVAAEQVTALARKGDKGADVLIVTDGIDHSDGQKEAIGKLTKLGARLRTVAIECNIAETSPLRALAVEYIKLGEESLTDHTSVQIFRNAV